VDGLLVRSAGSETDGLVLASSLGGPGGVGLVAVEVSVGGHPVELAEKAAVADQVLGGRLILVLRGDDEGSLIETAHVVSAAVRARPFAAGGRRWPTPALLEANTVSWTAIRVTPTPHQMRLPVFVSGAAGRTAALELAVPYFADATDDTEALAQHWEQMTSRYGAAAWHLTRGGIRPFTGTDTASSMNLVRDRQRWGAELVFLQPVEKTSWTGDTVSALASRLKPRLALNELPTGLDEFWEQTLTD
jgi:alkanesulfonate monooxygenase SsuD/methylene tetrahydromethanopterin reductase-like flavin-dependent oxidoreductase (luciferase family)